MKIQLIKKAVAVLLLVVCMIQLIGCGNNDQLTGTWVLTAAAANGESIDVAGKGRIEMQLNSDGTAILTTDSQTAKSTWSYKDGVLTIDGMTYTFEENVITFSYENVYMKYTKSN